MTETPTTETAEKKHWNLGAILFWGCCFWVVVGLLQQDSDQTEESSPRQVQQASKEQEVFAGYREYTLRYTSPDRENRQRQVYLWYPTETEAEAYNYRWQRGFATKDASLKPGKHPVILFSHGFLGGGKQTIFLTEALAQAGYIVAAIDHADAGGGLAQGKLVGDPKFGNFKAWDDQKYRDRRDDIIALLDDLLQRHQQRGSFLHQHIDAEKIGAMGHSLGGYTVAGLIGGWSDWHEQRIKAAALFSPYVLPYTHKRTLDQVKIPTMLHGATFDLGITPFLPGAYRQLPAPKYFLVLKNRGHFAWTNLISLDQTTAECSSQGTGKLICDYTIAFFDHHLLGKDRSSTLHREDDELHNYQYVAE